MNDLISRNEAAKRLEDLAKQKEDTFTGDVLEFAAKVVRGVPASDVPHWATEAAYRNGYEQGMKDAADNNVGSKWISVKDRLPEIVSTHKRYRNTINKSIRVLCVCVQKSGKTMVKEGYCEWYNDYPEPRWQIPGTIDDVTHWQYLPQPPKGE